MSVSSVAYGAPPDAVDDDFSTPRSTSLSNDLSLNDSGLDGPADNFSKLSDPIHGTVVVNTDGTFTYTPQFGFAGIDSFIYSIADGAGDSDSATAVITVEADSDDIITTASLFVTPEDTSVPLGLTIDANLLSGGPVPDYISGDIGFRASTDGTMPVVVPVPSAATTLAITGYSTRDIGTPRNDERNDDYAVFTARVDLIAGNSSGSMAYIANDTLVGEIDSLDQYSWESVPLGAAVLSDASKVIGLHTHETANPTISLVGGNLHITNTHDLETAYLVEFFTAEGNSAKFIQAGSTIQFPSTTISTLEIPVELEPVSGRNGFIALNANGAATGGNANIEAKVFNRLLIDLDSKLVSGTIAAEQGETEARTVTYAFKDYPLVDLREGGSSNPVSVLSSSATMVVGDTVGIDSTRDDPTIYIDVNGELVIERSSSFATTFTSLYTAEFYERISGSSTATVLAVVSDDALFDSQPVDQVDANNKAIDQLLFPIPAEAEIGIFRLSWSRNGGENVNENAGVGFAVIDIKNASTSGSTIIIRSATPDIVSWDEVPFGETMFGAVDTSGDPLFISNRTADASGNFNFVDNFGQSATFSVITQSDGSELLEFAASAPGLGEDYQGNAQVTWLGRGQLEVTGFPILGTLSHGTLLPSGLWEVDIADIPSLAYIPKEHVSGEDLLNLRLTQSGETEDLRVIVEPVTDTLTLSANDAQGNINSAIALGIVTTDSLDIDGSESQLSTIELDGVPSTVTLVASAGSVVDNGGGNWSLSANALASLEATGTVALSQVINVSSVNIDAVDLDGDALIEDNDNGSGADEQDELALSTIFTLTINDIPVVSASSTTASAGSVAIISLASSVADADNDEDLSTIDLDPSMPGNQSTLTTADGVWSVDSSGVASFDPVAGFQGTASISYNIEDALGNESNFAALNATIAGAAPIVTPDGATVAANSTAIVDLSDNVSDANNNAFIGSIDLDPTTPGIQSTLTTLDGEWSVDAAGLVTFIPDPSFEGTATIPYTIEDTDGLVSNPATIAVTVEGATPVGNDVVASVAAGDDALIDLLPSVSDANSDLDVATIDLDPTTPGIQSTLTTPDGEWSVDAAGELIFIPVPGFEGVATIAYTIEDDDGNKSIPADIAVTVEGAIPVGNDVVASVAAGDDALIDLLPSVSDANSDLDVATIDLDPTTPGIQSTLTTPDGEWSVDAAGLVTFVPVPGFEGGATIPFTIEDDDGNVSIPADISVTVEGAIPVAIDASGSVLADSNAVIDLQQSISDANDDIDPGTIDLDPATPGIQSTLTTDDGEWAVDDSGILTFNPAEDFEGLANIDYTVEDDDGHTSNVANVSITVAGAPPIVDANTTTTSQDVDVVIDVLIGASDANDDIDASSIDLDPSTPGIQSTLSIAGEGVFSVVGNQVVFDPLASFTGVSALTYTVSDESGNVSNPAEISVSVNMLPDTDADGIPDNLDLDDDNDGIPDALEGTNDTDGDGVIDSLDLDSDNDGIPDIIEAGAPDLNGDGVVDNYTDENSDGLDDLVASNPLPVDDFDQDGIANYLDVDSDNDGLVDALEAGGSDANGDGIIDGFTDVNGDGLNDATAANPTIAEDTDGDGQPDYLDLDSDNDGVTDLVEGGGLDSNGDGIVDNVADADGDGLADILFSAPLPIIDTDGDGTPDYLQLPVIVASTDSDGDGIPDALESSSDTDGDGIPDFLDIDSDNDGLLDRVEAGATTLEPVDTDGDGILDYLDLDSDNDGLSDVFEAGGDDVNGDGVVDNFADSNGDGHDDGVALAALEDPDSDGDGIADHLDLDSDNDGLPDVLESSGLNSDNDGNGLLDSFVDTNGDGLADGFVANSQIDSDADGTPNHLDLDSDGDGLLDIVEAGGADVDGNGEVDVWADTDGDGVLDNVDVDIVGGEDLDGDSIADFADADFVDLPDADNDGVVDAFDDDFGGTGFSPILTSALPDSNADGVPDLLQALPSGIIHTGLSGSGCSILPVPGSTRAAYDPSFFLLSLSAFLFLVFSRKIGIGVKTQQ